MKRCFCLILLLLISPLLICDDFKLIKSDALFQERFFSLGEGSEKQAAFIDYLESFCRSRGLNYRLAPVQGESYTSSSFNFQIDIKGRGASGEKSVFIFPLNSIYIDQKLTDLSLSLQVALDLIDECLNYTFERDLVFLFSGANGREGEEMLGLKSFLNENSKALERSFVNIVDIGALPGEITFTGSLNDRPIPALVLDSFIKSRPDAAGVTFKTDEIHKARFRLLAGYESLSYFAERDIIAVAFENVDSQPGGAALFDGGERYDLVEYFVNWLIIFDTLELYSNIDYNYKFLELPGYKLVIPEFTQIVFYLVILLLLIAVRAFVAYGHRQRVKLIIRIFPYFIALFFLFFLLSYLPRALTAILEHFVGGEEVYLTNPGLYLFNSFLIPLLIIYILFELIKKLPFPKHNYLYIYGAVIFSYINLLLFTIFDISLTYIYMWTVLFFTLSHFTGKNFGLKYFSYLLSTIPLVKLFYDLLIAGNLDFVRERVDSPYLLNLTFCLLTFPYLLIAIRVYLINSNKFKILPSKLAHAIILFAVILISLLFYSITSLDRVGEELVIRGSYINESGRQNSRLELIGNASLGAFQIEESGVGSDYNFEAKECSIQLNLDERPYSFKVDESTLAFSRLVKLELLSEKEIDEVELYLECPDKINPLDSNYRFLKVEDSPFNKDDNDVYRFLIPKRPGRTPLIELELLPVEEYRVHLTLSYLGLDEGLTLSSRAQKILIKSYYKEQLELKF